jgi:hypothetical protein
MANKYWKAGVDLREMTPQSLLAWDVAAEVYERHGKICRVTSLYRMGTWDQVLLHGRGMAVDFGLRDLDGSLYDGLVIDSIVDELTHRLGKPGGGQYDVVDERNAPGGPHIHIEFDPKA